VCHHLLADARLWPFLIEIDRDLAEKTRAGGCVFCSAPIHCADYPRKPRGVDDLPEGYELRFSFCCSIDGCRRRTTPPSVRFLGPKVYLGVLVILLTAMRQGPTPRGFKELHRLFGVSRRTLARWQVWWREIFTRGAFWRGARARFSPPLGEAALPSTLFAAFEAESGLERFLLLLKFLSPITTRQALVVHDL
jgi:hypothetical protein